MAENVKDDRLAEMDRIFKINNPNYKNLHFYYKEDVHFASIKEVNGFYVASSIKKKDVKEVYYGAADHDSKGELGKSLYFILPKNNKQSKGVVIDMESHPWYGYNQAFTEITLNVEGKKVASIRERVHIDVADTLSVRQFLGKHKDGRYIIKFLNKFVVDKEEVRKQRRENIKVIKDAIKNKIEHIKSRCRSIHDRIEENREQARENQKVKKTMNYYIRPRGRNS